MKPEAEHAEPLVARARHVISRALAFVVAYFGSVFFHAYESTLDIRPRGVEHLNLARREGRRVLAAFWHGKGMAPMAWLQGQQLCLYASWDRSGPAPTVAQRMMRDTALAIVGRLGYEVIDASRLASESRGVIHLLKLIQKCSGAVMAPDGPSGPAGQAKPGAAFIAEKTKAVIIPIGQAMERGVHLDGWDSFEVPAPFSRVAVVFGEALELADDASEADSERFTKRIEDALQQTTRRAEELLPKKVARVTRGPLAALVLLAQVLVIALVLLTMFANVPGWLLLYPLLIAALLVVSGLIVITLLRRL